MPLAKFVPKTTEPVAVTSSPAAVTQADAAKYEAPKAAEKPAYTGRKASTSETMTKADWQEKDVRISRQGLYQAALQSVGAMQYSTSTSLEDYLKLVRKVADDGLDYVNGGGK